MTMSLSDSILVIEDDTDHREMLVAYLQLRGFMVHAGSDGAMALALADANRPRVILMNLSMSSVDGLETTRSLRANAGIRETMIVAVIARAGTNREAAHRAGCNFVFPKPLEPDHPRQFCRRPFASLGGAGRDRSASLSGIRR
jgi:CheY-like chemotaxis protein